METRKRTREAVSKPLLRKKRKVERESQADEVQNLYPLQGMYKNETDRAWLLGMREFQREAVLTARFDELASIRDREHMRSSTRRPPATPKSTHAPLVARKLAGVAAVEDDTFEEDAVEHTPPPRHAQVDPRAAGSPKVAIRQRPSATAKDKPLENRDLLRLSLTRDELAGYSSLPWFEKLVTGAWVRYLSRSDQDESRAYRIYQIKGVGTAEELYQVGDYTTRHLLELKNGGMEVMLRMDRVSNSGWSESSTASWRSAQPNGWPCPTRKEINDLCTEKQKLMSRDITEKQINKMLADKRKIGAPLRGTQSTRLRAERELAVRLGEHTTVRRIDARLSRSSAPHPPTETKDPLALVNERNRTANMEAVRKAERLEVERKRSIREAHMMPTVVADESGSGGEQIEPHNNTVRHIAARQEAVAVHKLNPGKTLIEKCIESIELDLGDF
ncbi:hypothetical protein C8J57DRAFT_1506287 [Mycena rebaudengoi]|nr:hypothetical protein C8J57DRAFT_1506287 [Mycena rebaudengoi]